MFIDELKSFSTPTEARPPNYFEYHIDTIIIVLNVMTGILRITGSVMIIFFITILKIEKKRNESEKNESLMKIQEEPMRDSIYVLNETNLKIETPIMTSRKDVTVNENTKNSDRESPLVKL